MIKKLIASGLLTGYAPVAPGTAGSLFCCILLYFIPEIRALHKLIILAVLFIIGALISSELEKEWGKDPSKIVIDEVAGMLCTLIAAPKSLVFYGAGFLLFRFFDIVKPFPVKSGEKLKGGWGIMADDILAGLYAALVLQIIILLYHRL